MNKELFNSIKAFARSNAPTSIIGRDDVKQIAAALEAAQYPPIVRAVLAFLEHVDLGKEWAAVSDDAGIYMFDVKPSFDPFFGFWLPSESICAYNLYLTISIEIAETLLFQRTANGWEWIGKPENEADEVQPDPAAFVPENYALFVYLSRTFGATATDDQLWDIVEIVRGTDKVYNTEPKKITLSFLRQVLADFENEKISMSRMLEMINEQTTKSMYATGPVKCLLCSHEWIAVRPANTKALECPNCENINEVEEL